MRISGSSCWFLYTGMRIFWILRGMTERSWRRASIACERMMVSWGAFRPVFLMIFSRSKTDMSIPALARVFRVRTFSYWVCDCLNISISS